MFSDIKVRNVYKGEVKEYYAHKAILCSQSKWFMKVLSGIFKVRLADDVVTP